LESFTGIDFLKLWQILLENVPNTITIAQFKYEEIGARSLTLISFAKALYKRNDKENLKPEIPKNR
jgi:hypothetical protein